jgi:hypothetical protein
VLGPVYVLVTGMASMGVAEAARAAHRSAARLRRVCLLTAAIGATGTLAWGGVLILGVPDALGRAVLGDTWQPAAALLVPLTIAFAGTAALAGPWAGVRALGAARRSLRAQLLTSGLTLAGSLAGAAVNDAAGAAWGTAAAGVVSAGVWWWHLRGAVADGIADATTVG